MTEHDDCEELASGTWGTVQGLRDASGGCPSLDWLAGLSDREQAGMQSRLTRLAEVGWLVTPEAFKKLTSDGREPVVYEVKHVGLNLRLYVVKGNHVFYATHGGKKPKKNRVAGEIAKARSIYQESQQ
jgi:hypothetical protein